MKYSSSNRRNLTTQTANLTYIHSHEEVKVYTNEKCKEEHTGSNLARLSRKMLWTLLSLQLKDHIKLYPAYYDAVYMIHFQNKAPLY